ncbi:MAG: nitronate monooxygenase [Candidatus Competibacteraceae bacterium]|nr:nitronate monooxygenase [Candidatus Competibacteraceae bacterium]
MNWADTPLTRRLELRYPLIQAPMAGGATTPELVAAVCNAGGLGSLGADYLDPEDIRTTIRHIRELTDGPFAVNLFIPESQDEDPQCLERTQERLRSFRQALELPVNPPLPEPFAPPYQEQLAVVLEEQVAAFSFTFGVPRPEELEALHQQDILTLGTATHVLEAIVLEESGVDMIVAQGMEAGGHRGTFIAPQEPLLVGTLALVPLIMAQVKSPVIAAGGIMDGRGIAAALALGAVGAQLGTAFLRCPESGIHPLHKAALVEGNEANTVLTRSFSGRWARAIRNRFITDLAPFEGELPGYPALNALTRDIRQEAARRGRPEFLSLWAGMGCSLAQAAPAGELVARWVAQIRERVGNPPYWAPDRPSL